MSDVVGQDPGKAAGQAVGVTLSWFMNWLNDKSALAVFLILVLAFVVIAIHWAVTEIIPHHIELINEGRKAEAEINAKCFQEQRTYDEKRNTDIMSFMKDQQERYEKHSREILASQRDLIEVLRDNQKPIAVNPLGGS